VTSRAKALRQKSAPLHWAYWRVVRSVKGLGCSRCLIGKCTGILRNLAPFLPPSSIASVDLDKEILLPVLVPVVSSVSLQEATETVRELVLALQARHGPTSIPSLTKRGGE
jgi:hypothetical protein